jgi:hypothetical protein
MAGGRGILSDEPDWAGLFYVQPVELEERPACRRTKTLDVIHNGQFKSAIERRGSAIEPSGSICVRSRGFAGA